MGCADPVNVGVVQTCDARQLEAGEVRARHIPCGDELIDDGNGRRSDWLLENARLRVVVRDGGNAQTRLDVGGGTIVDLARWGESDALEEIVPWVGSDWLVNVDIEARNDEAEASLHVTGWDADGSEAAVVYRLAADADELELEGIDGFTVVPQAGADLVGDIVELSAQVLLGSDGVAEDRGGWIDMVDTSVLTVGRRAELADWRWPDAETVSGSVTPAASGWIEVLEGGEPVFRWPISRGEFSGTAPTGTELVAQVPGYLASEATPADTDMEISLGEAGFARVRVHTPDGIPLAARFSWGDDTWTVPPGGALLSTGPGSAPAAVSAGPAWSMWSIDTLTIEGTIDVDILLSRSEAPAMLADIAVVGWPDSTERRPAQEIAEELAAGGVGFAVLLADDAVARASIDGRVAETLFVRGGSRAGGPHGSPLAWPWSRSSNRAAYGAAPWAGLDATQLLAWMDDAGDRRTVVDTTWIAAAGAPVTWDPQPTAVRLASLDELSSYTALLDRWLDPVLVGPLTWIEGLDEDRSYSRVDVESMLLAGRTVATTGPMVELRIDGQGPGATIEPGARPMLHLEVHAPAWIELEGAAIVSTGGEVLETFTLGPGSGRRLSVSRPLADTPWVLAVCWGPGGTASETWAATGPIWLGRP